MYPVVPPLSTCAEKDKTTPKPQTPVLVWLTISDFSAWAVTSGVESFERVVLPWESQVQRNGHEGPVVESEA